MPDESHKPADRIRVALIIPTLVQGGAEKQLSLLARHLPRDEFECHVVVLTHSGPIEQELLDAGLPVHLIGKHGKLDPTALFRLTRKLKELQPDIVHTWLFAANSYGRVAARRAGVPVIIAGERCVDPWKKWWHHAIDRRLRGYTDTIITNTSAVVEFYAEHGYQPQDFTVIPNAIEATEETPADQPDFEQRKADALRSLGLEPRTRIVGAVGRLWKQKGYEDLIWAAELLRVAHEDVWFLILGDGPDLRKLQTFRDKIGAHRAVRFLGHRQDARHWIGCLDVLWNGSLYEGQSNTIMEAMSLGVPVVASDIPGNRDLISHGETGLLYTPGDLQSLIKQTRVLLNNDLQRRQLGRQAQQRMREHHSVEKLLSRHADVYRKLLLQAKERCLFPAVEKASPPR